MGRQYSPANMPFSRLSQRIGNVLLRKAYAIPNLYFYKSSANPSATEKLLENYRIGGFISSLLKKIILEKRYDNSISESVWHVEIRKGATWGYVS